MWILAVLQLKSAILGNAAWKLVTQTPEKILNRSLEKIEIGDLDDEDSEESNFLYNFTLSIVCNFLLLLAEVAIGAYILFTAENNITYYLAFTLLYKNLIIFAVFCTFKVQKNGISLFESLNLIPKWAISLDRISCFLSAMIFGALIYQEIN